MQPDTAIVQALNLDPNTSSLRSVGRSDFSSTFHLSAKRHGLPVGYFIKTASGPSASTMFRGEHASLNAIHAVVPGFCPRAHAHGPLSSASADTHFLATDFLDGLGSPVSSSAASLASKLAKLHSTPAPVPEGFDRPVFGFPVTTCCGDTQQDNSWTASWADFYANHRLRAIASAIAPPDAEMLRCVEDVVRVVVPRLIGQDRINVRPVVVHGDLWSGNHSTGRIGEGDVHEVVFDPACVYGHSEYDLGIMRMFGGFDSAFWSEYERLVPRDEPRDEWPDRLLLYELYHHLNHYSIFGTSYRGGAMSIMKKLLSKYAS